MAVDDITPDGASPSFFLRVIAKFAASGKVQAKKDFGFMRMQCRNMYEGKYIC